MPWIWPLLHTRKILPQGPGSFGAVRKHDIHTGVDLYAAVGTPVFAVESGTIVAIQIFTGPQAGSPWWRETFAVLVSGASGVVCYGEIKPIGDLEVGQKIQAGKWLGEVMEVLRVNKGKPTSMLHLELYSSGTTSPVSWELGEEQPSRLLDPTPSLERVLNLEGSGL